MKTVLKKLKLPECMIIAKRIQKLIPIFMIQPSEYPFPLISLRLSEIKDCSIRIAHPEIGI